MADEVKVQAVPSNQIEAGPDNPMPPVADDPVKPEVKEEPKKSIEDRIADVIANYEHNLFHNGPRQPSELEELKAIHGEMTGDIPDEEKPEEVAA